MSSSTKDYVLIVLCWITSKILKHVNIIEILGEILQDCFGLKRKSLKLTF